MELRQYWGILARRWPLIGVICGLTFVLSAVMLALGPSLYKAELRLTVSIKPETRQGNYYMFDHYYNWLATEYLVDDIGEVIKSDAFTGDVAQRLGQQVPAQSIKRDLTTKKTHRILQVNVTTFSAQQSHDIASAIKETVELQAADYFAQLSSQDAVVRVIDGPSVELEMGLLRRTAELVLRTLVGLLAAVALAFLLHYLDRTIRNAEEAERLLGLPVLTEVPK